MGRTKALLAVDGVPMAQRVGDALAGAGCSTVLAYGGDPEELRSLSMPVQPDRYPGQGPAGGVLGVLEHTRRSFGSCSHLFVVACDLPGLTAAALLPMVEHARRHPDADAVVAATAGIEPACAIWNVGSTPQLRRRFDDGERALHAVLSQLVTIRVAVDAAALRNINTPDDLRRYS